MMNYFLVDILVSSCAHQQNDSQAEQTMQKKKLAAQHEALTKTQIVKTLLSCLEK